jgi:hypothetical protein
MRNNFNDGTQGDSTLWKLTQAITAHARSVVRVPPTLIALLASGRVANRGFIALAFNSRFFLKLLINIVRIQNKICTFAKVSNIKKKLK